MEETQVAIIGGGVIGCSIAYHLTKMGWKDVQIIEKGQLTAGSTWHAAGLVHQARDSLNGSKMLQYSVELYQQLEEETGQATGWRGNGSLRLACTGERMLELKRSVTMAKSYGLNANLMTPREAQNLFPLMSTEKMEGAMLVEGDGYGDPSALTQALAKGARMRGTKILTNTRVLGMSVENNRVTRIETDKGPIRAEFVVNAGGVWAREIGAMVGVFVPVSAYRHQYLVTEEIQGITDGLPNMRDPDHLLYYKQEVMGLVVGGFERNPIPWARDGVPKEFGQELFDSDYDQFEQIMESAIMRTPCLETTGVRKLINGPIPVTPDGHYIMGPAPGLENFFLACGFTYGVGAGGGAGRMIAEWIVEGRPSLNLWTEDVRRFGKVHASNAYLYDRSTEMFGKYYAIHWPNDEHESARGIRRSPLYETLKKHGAVYGQKFGWERANWFAPKGVVAKNIPTWGRPNSFEHVAIGHRAARERVAIFDQSSFGKIEVHGPGALALLQRLSTANLDRPPGRTVYTLWLNEEGGIEADLTVTRLTNDSFYVVTGTALINYNLDWIQRHQTRKDDAVISDVTSSRSVIGVMGPLSRVLFEKVSDTNFGNDHFPFGSCRTIYIGHAPVRAIRMTFVGELGWELHIPIEYTAHVYETLWAAGQDLGVANAGYLAIDSLRLEKRNLLWGSDIDLENNPYEAGLGFCVSKKKQDFIGKQALEQLQKKGVYRKLCCFTIDDVVQFFGSETISRKGEILGLVTTGGFGHTIGQSVAYGYIPLKHTEFSDFEIEAFNHPYPAKRHDKVLYDPTRANVMA